MKVHNTLRPLQVLSVIVWIHIPNRKGHFDHVTAQVTQKIGNRQLTSQISLDSDSTQLVGRVQTHAAWYACQTGGRLAASNVEGTEFDTCIFCLPEMAIELHQGDLDAGLITLFPLLHHFV